ncbi:MAG: ribosomal protein S18-alanine N-acetyltransferase [Ruminococcus sp.]|nr:ribosomal protein S18-alanine N-acetyltransferase [Ruminococcus sp.]
MIICKMTQEHLCGVMEVEHNSFTHPWSENSFMDEINKDSSFCYVALQNDTVVGFAVLETVLDEGNLLDIAVDEKHRRQGVARELFKELFKVADEKKLSFITLEVRESSIPAISLYEAHGFEKVGVRKNYYSKPTENAVLMTKYFNL